MAHKRITRDVWIVQVNYGYGHGWEDECVEYSRAEAWERLREYRVNAPQYQSRVRMGRERITNGCD